MRANLSLVVALLVAIAPAAHAQDSVTVAAGARVRAYVTPPGAWRVGTVTRLAGDTLYLRPAGCVACEPTALPRASVPRLDVSAGLGGHPFRGMALGLVAGAAVGAFVVAPCPNGNAGSEGPPCGLGQGLATISGALAGLLVGGVVGAYWPPRERWRQAWGS